MSKRNQRTLEILLDGMATGMKWAAWIFAAVITLLMLYGCDIPDVPDGAACTPTGFVMKLSEDSNPLDYTTWEFVLDEQGAAMSCSFN